MHKYLSKFFIDLIFLFLVTSVLIIFRADYLGLLSILLVCFVVILMTNHWRPASSILYTALLLRLATMIIGEYLILPDSYGDTDNFEKKAWMWSQGSFANTLGNFPGPQSFFISWLGAIPYSLFERSILMLRAMSLLFGMGSVLLGWLIVKKIWDNDSARMVGWILALFPSLVLYSTLFLREPYIYFFLLVAIYGVVDWVKFGSIKSIIIASIGFIGAFFFNGPMIIGYFVFLIIIAIFFLKKFLEFIRHGYIHKQGFIILLLIILFFGYYFADQLYIPKLGTFSETNFGWAAQRLDWNVRGDAAYPDWLRVSTPVELIFKAPIKVIYLVFSPFPWDFRKPVHFWGMLDGLFYIFITYLIFCNRKVILKSNVLKFIFIILIAYLTIYGIAVGNFGTGIRHRSKFLFLLLILAAPLIPKIKFFSKNKLRN